MNEYIFYCPNCGQKFDVDDGMVGTPIACPACGKPIIVPANNSLRTKEKREGDDDGVSRKNDSSGNKRIKIKRINSPSASNVSAYLSVDDSNDVHFIGVIIAKIVYWIFSIFAVVGFGYAIAVGMMIKFVPWSDKIVSCGMLLLQMIGSLFGLRLMYEGFVALFEVVRHLRQIRDTLRTIADKK